MAQLPSRPLIFTNTVGTHLLSSETGTTSEKWTQNAILLHNTAELNHLLKLRI